jgi:GLPGLI family protein
MKHFFFVFLVCAKLSIAQHTHGVGYYRIVFDSDKEIVQNAYKQQLDEIEKQAKKLKFELIFDQTTSFFGLVKDLKTDKEDFASKMAMTIFGADKAYSTNWKEGYFVESISFLGQDFLIKKNIADLDWELSKEKRIISGNVCYKAIGSRGVMDNNFEIQSFDIVAWYCPEIPFNYGPFEAVGLPGLVFELEVKGYSLVLENLIWGKKPEKQKMLKGKVISQKEYDSIFKKMVKVRMPD